MYYIYILQSEKSGLFYVGQTNDVDRRVLEHNTSLNSKFTNRHIPWRLMAKFEVGCDRGIALRIEHHIKKQKSKKYIEDILLRNSIEMIINRYSVNP